MLHREVEEHDRERDLERAPDNEKTIYILLCNRNHHNGMHHQNHQNNFFLDVFLLAQLL